MRFQPFSAPKLLLMAITVGLLLQTPVWAQKKKKGAAAKPVASAAAGGYFRVVNTGQRPNVYDFTLRFHQAPWQTKNDAGFAAGIVPPGGATEWVHLPRFTKLKPITLQVMTSRQTGNRLKALGGEQEENVGRVEFAASAPVPEKQKAVVDGSLEGDAPQVKLGDEKKKNADAPPAENLLRAIDMNGRMVTVELEQPAFTKAEQIKQDLEIGAETLALVRSFKFKGKAPERFPTGWPSGTLDEYRAGRVLGFTAVAAGSPRNLPGRGKALFDELGFRYIYTHTNWLELWNQGGGGYRRDRNLEQMQKFIEPWREAGLLDRVYRVSLRDEAELYELKKKTEDALAGIHKDPPAWTEIMRWAGLKPADFIHPDNPPPAGAAPASPEYWQALRGAGPDQRAKDPQRVYNTMQTWQATWSARFGNVREALQEAAGQPLRITANIHFKTFFSDLGGFDPWNEYAKLRTLDIPQVCDYGVGWPQQEEWLIDLLRCAMRPHPGGVDAMLQAQQRYMPRPPEHLKLCAMSAIGAGARSLSFYRWGPRYLDTENWYNTDPERLRVIGEVNHAVGWVEDILLDGAPRPAHIAFMTSRPSAMWDMLTPAPDQPSPGMYSRNLRTTYHLLRGLQHQVDFINDTVLPRDQGVDIDQYKVIFIMQRCLPKTAAEELLAWVGRGGTLVGVLSIGQFDHLEQPSALMLAAFGLKSLKVQKADGEDAPWIPEAGVTLRGSGAAVGRVEVGDATVIQRFQDGSPAVTQRKLGKGELIYAAFEPGGAYHRMDVSREERSQRAKELRLLTGMQESVRDLIRPWLHAAGEPICATSHPLVSARLIQAPGKAAVILVNSAVEDRIPGLKLTLRSLAPSRAESLNLGELPLQPAGDAVSMEFAMERTEVVRLELKSETEKQQP